MTTDGAAGRHVVLYDGDCAFCARWRDRMAARDRGGRVEWLSVHDAAVATRFPGLDREDAMRQMYVYAPDGTLTKGADGWITLCSVIPGLRVLAALSRIPGVPPVLRRVYRFIAARRYRLSCANASCRARRDAGRGGSATGGAPLAVLALLLAAGTSLALSGCGAQEDPLVDRLAAIADPAAAAVLRATFRNYGGYDAWARHETVEYLYTLEIYNGRKEPFAVSRQLHRLGLREERAYVEELDVDEPRVVRLDGDALEVRRGGLRITEPDELEYPRALSRLVRWSFMHPWNLLGPGSVLEGRATRTPPAEGTIPADPCDVVRHRLTRDGRDGGVESDDWQDFYISRLSRLVDRVHSYRADDHTYRVSIWSDYWTVGGVRVATRRRTYASDELGMLGQLEGIATYSDIRFDVPIEDSLSDSQRPLAASAGGE